MISMTKNVVRYSLQLDNLVATQETGNLPSGFKHSPSLCGGAQLVVHFLNKAWAAYNMMAKTLGMSINPLDSHLSTVHQHAPAMQKFETNSRLIWKSNMSQF